MMYAHFIKHADGQMWFGFLVFLAPAIPLETKFGIYYSLGWIIITLLLILLLRCWDDPYELGWLEK